MSKTIILLIMLSLTGQACYIKGDQPVLEYKIRAPKIEIENPPLLILLHGVGSNEDDLLQLAEYLPKNYLIISARAPYNYSESRFKWYDVDFSTGSPVINYEQAEKSRLILKQFINQLKSLHTFDHGKIIIGGFSQGAIMSYSLGLTEPHLVEGIMALSGRMLEEIKPNIKSKIQDELEFLIIHGTDDRVLSVNYARQAKNYLEQRNFKVDYHETRAGHTITNESIQFMNTWLSKI
jgi:phospholipase/carboxylesterase